jgi:hypothetical protein
MDAHPARRPVVDHPTPMQRAGGSVQVRIAAKIGLLAPIFKTDDSLNYHESGTHLLLRLTLAANNPK